MRIIKVIAIFLILLLCGEMKGEISESILLKKSSFPDPDSKTNDEYLTYPCDLAINKGLFYVVDPTEGRIKVFSGNGRLIKTVGRKGPGPGELSFPYAVAIDDYNEILYCYNEEGRRISIFKLSGEFLKEIKTSLPIWDVIVVNEKLYAVAYNENRNTILLCMNKEGVIERFFGERFDNSIEHLSSTYKIMFYGNATICSKGDDLYVFYEKIPYIQIYSNEGKLKRTIEIIDKEVQGIYKTNQNPKQKGTKMYVYNWHAGACVDGEDLYVYCPYKIKRLLRINMKGQIVERIKLENGEDDWLKYQKFVVKRDKEYIFADFINAVVSIYKKTNDSWK